MTTALVQTCINFSTYSNFHVCPCRKQSCSKLRLLHPISPFPLSRPKVGSLRQTEFKFKGHVRETRSFLGGGSCQNWNLARDEGGWRGKKRAVVVRFNQGFGFNGGGGDRDNSGNVRLLGNLAVAIGLTYLSITGQLGWVLDAIVSIWVTLSLSLLLSQF